VCAPARPDHRAAAHGYNPRRMKIAILSDIHDNLWNLAIARDAAREADVMLCCGDLCSPFVMDELAKFAHQVHIVFGNNDADLFRITRKSSDRVRVYGEFFEAELGGRRFAMNHFDYLARPIAASGMYDVVCYGHNHRFQIERVGKTLFINPGPIMGAAFYTGEWKDVPPTFVIYDSEADTARGYQLEGGAAREFGFGVE
jgi:putative phosphoesterase